MTSGPEEFWLDPERYYSETLGGGPGGPRPLAGSHVENAEVAIGNVIARYGLAGRDIVSLASGDAFEEYWMLRAGASVTCVDDFSDHHGHLRVERASLAVGPSRLRYVKSDFSAFVGAADRTYDVCYVSSFPPDEQARGRIQAAHLAACSFFSRIVGRALRTGPRTWPETAAPFIQPMMDTRKLIRKGGLLLIQSYAFGVDIVRNPHYPYLVAGQMADNDLALLEIHYFRRAPYVVLIAASAGIETGKEWRERMAEAPQINEFHGRFPLKDVRSDVGIWKAPVPGSDG